jgi:hypothetical protein
VIVASEDWRPTLGIGDFLGRQCVLEEHCTEESTAWPSENETVTSGKGVLKLLLSQEFPCKFRLPKTREHARKRLNHNSLFFMRFIATLPSMVASFSLGQPGESAALSSRRAVAGESAGGLSSCWSRARVGGLSRRAHSACLPTTTAKRWRHDSRAGATL